MILITSHQSITSLKLAYLIKDQEIIFGDFYEDFPKIESISLAHEILKFCLDHHINQVYPTRFEDLAPLKNATVLFKEFDINIMLSQEDDFVFNHLSAVAETYTDLSSKILALGYPNQKIALGDATGKGNLISIDDEVKDFSNIWTSIKTFSFIQMGKLLNQPEFKNLHLYKYQLEIKSVFILADQNGELKFFELLDNELQIEIKNHLKSNNCLGFYQVDYDAEKVLRIKNAALSC